jgi:hypothetical protein
MLLNDDKIYFIELLSDLSNYGGTMYLYLINNLVKVSSSIAMASAAATAADTNTTLFVNETVVDSSGANNSQKQQQQLPQIILRGCFLFESMNYKKCPDGYHITASTDAHNEIHNTMLNVPYPMIGKWYLALWKECVDRETKYETLKMKLNFDLTVSIFFLVKQLHAHKAMRSTRSFSCPVTSAEMTIVAISVPAI